MVGVRGGLAMVLLVVAIVVLVKRPKQYILITIFCLAAIVLFIVFSVPYYKDIAKKETTAFVGTFLKDQVGFAGTKPWIFMVSDERVSVETCIWSGDYNNYFEEGRTYKVTYYVNTRIIAKVELIE